MTHNFKENNDWTKSLRLTSVWIGHTQKILNRRMPLFTKDYIRKQCEAVAKNGFNAVAPSIGHFRWSFVKNFGRILETIADFSRIGKEYGLRCCEHHSVMLMYPKKMKYKKWDIGSCVQQDARGKPLYASGGYNCTHLCTTNPHFVEAYKDHVKDIIDTGIEMFMPDDMSAAIDWYTCCCPHCRKLFRKLTGYTLPKPGDIDGSFYGNMDNPAFRAWIRFRLTRVALFLKDLKKFMDSQRKGIKLFSCNSDNLPTSGRYYGQNYEEWLAHANLDFGLHELWCAEMVEYNWPRDMTELQVTKAMSDHYKVPVICWGYSASNEQAIYCRTRDMLNGLRPHGCYKDILPNEYRHMNGFESAHQQVFSNAVNLTNVGILFSMNTRDFYGPTTFTRTNLDIYSDEFAGWCEGLLKALIPYRVLIDQDIEKNMVSDLDVLVLPNVTCFSQKMADNIAAFVQKGGTLIATHETSRYDEKGTQRNNFLLKEVFGFDCLGTEKGVNYPLMINYAADEDVWYNRHNSYPLTSYDPGIRDQIFLGIDHRRIKHHASQTVIKIRDKKIQMLAHTPIIRGASYGFPAVVYREYGRGRILYFTGLPGLLNPASTYFNVSQYGEDPYEVYDESLTEYARIIANSVKWALGDREQVTVDGADGKVIVNLFQSENKDAVYVHLAAVPATRTTANGKRIVPVPTVNDSRVDWFFNWASWEKEITKPDDEKFEYFEVPALRIYLNPAMKVRSAKMISPDFYGEKEIKLRRDGDRQMVGLQRGDIHRYSVVILGK